MSLILEVPPHLSETEEWGPIPGTYGWYEASSLGRIRSWVRPGPRGSFRRPQSRKEPLILNPTVGKRGYRVWCHRLDGKESRRTVHLAVCETFHGLNPYPKGVRAEVRHLDGDPLNNRVDNLRWGTAKENAADRVVHGTTLRGERNPFAKLSLADVVKIRAWHGAVGWDVRSLAEFFGVSRATIQRIINRETWRHVL